MLAASIDNRRTRHDQAPVEPKPSHVAEAHDLPRRSSYTLMLRFRANEIEALVLQLGSRSRSRVDTARARLSVLGPRAVEQLVECLEGSDTRVRARAMPLLALIRDSRAREPLIAMLLDRSPRLRRIAATCLGRFPAADSTAALLRLLDRERREDVRLAAVGSLVEHYAAGQERVLPRLLVLLADAEQPSTLRLAAFGVLRLLRPAHRRSLLERLRCDPDSRVRERAETLGGDREALPDAGEARIAALLSDLADDDYAVWNGAVLELGSCGNAIVEPLVAEMRRLAHDPEFCTRAGMALKALGRRNARALLGALETVEEAAPLLVLVEVAGALGDKATIYRLRELVERLAGRAEEPAVRRVRARAHLELARIGSRVAIHDLREALAQPGRRVELEMLAAVELIGKREEIGPLLLAWAGEDAFMRERIAGAVRAIMRRERIRRNDRRLAALPAEQRRALDGIVPPLRSRRRARERPGKRAEGPI